MLIRIARRFRPLAHLRHLGSGREIGSDEKRVIVIARFRDRMFVGPTRSARGSRRKPPSAGARRDDAIVDEGGIHDQRALGSSAQHHLIARFSVTENFAGLPESRIERGRRGLHQVRGEMKHSDLSHNPDTGETAARHV